MSPWLASGSSGMPTRGLLRVAEALRTASGCLSSGRRRRRRAQGRRRAPGRPGPIVHNGPPVAIPWVLAIPCIESPRPWPIAASDERGGDPRRSMLPIRRTTSCCDPQHRSRDAETRPALASELAPRRGREWSCGEPSFVMSGWRSQGPPRSPSLQRGHARPKRSRRHDSGGWAIRSVRHHRARTGQRFPSRVRAADGRPRRSPLRVPLLGWSSVNQTLGNGCLHRPQNLCRLRGRRSVRGRPGEHRCLDGPSMRAVGRPYRLS